MIGRTFSRYRIAAELGQGGMGVVYKAEDLRLGRAVALKFLPESAALDRQALDRFTREARAASALNHPHICTIHDIDEHEGQPFIVMELLEGQTLGQRIAGRRLDLETVVNLATQIAEGLGAAHAKGIIHRDIKSANIFVTHDGQAKILDFGLAKLVADAAHPPDTATVTSAPLDAGAKAFLTSPGQTMGTVAYMSPEQVRGEELDPRTDVFSFGVVLYEMVTSSLPFHGATAGVVFDAILNKAPAPITDLQPGAPAELAHILDKALEKDRELRYQSAREVRADLVRLKRHSGSTGAIPAMPAPQPAPAPAQRRWLLPVALGVSAILAAAIAYVVWFAPAPAPFTPAARQRTLTRVTFDEGLQAQPTWSADGRFIAYTSNTTGNFDIWVQPLGGGRPVQVTTDLAVDWQPAWSPDGNTIAFRSEREGGGVFIVPALGGRERKLVPFGYNPEWSPDGSKILVAIRPPVQAASLVIPHVYLLDPKGAPPARVLEAELAGFVDIGRIVWHPDGRRISFRGTKDGAVGFWTLPLTGGPAVRAEMSPEVQRELQGQLEAIGVSRWAPAGDAVYLEAMSQRVGNLWRVNVNPTTLEWVGGLTRLTTGSGTDGEVAIAPDGDKLAFVTRSETARLWSLPFDAESRRVTGEGAPITPANMSVSGFDLTPAGTLVYIAGRPGRTGNELWSGSIGGGEPVLLTEAERLFGPRLTRDGTRVGYRVANVQNATRRISWRSIGSGGEHTLAEGLTTIWDWSPAGDRMLHNCPPPARGATLCESPATATTTADARPILIDDDFSIWQGRYSPDGRWILFNAQGRKDPGVSILGVVPTSGGKWIPLTDSTLWADKARWGPDGRTIYFISNRDSAFFDVWVVEFDPARGALVSKESRVTRYDNPTRLVAATGLSELGIGDTRLVVPILETSGSVWILDHVKR